MDLAEAVSIHLKWKIRLNMIIEGNSADALDPAEVEKDDQCELGKWLHGPGGMVHQGRPEFTAVVGEHAVFHQYAAAILRKAAQGNRRGAQIDLDTGYQQQSQKVVMALRKLKEAIE